MKLYCQCGYPISVVAQWDGHDYHLSLRDTGLGKESPPITACPACGLRVFPGELERLQRPAAPESRRRHRPRRREDTTG